MIRLGSTAVCTQAIVGRSCLASRSRLGIVTLRAIHPKQASNSAIDQGDGKRRSGISCNCTYLIRSMVVFVELSYSFLFSLFCSGPDLRRPNVRLMNTGIKTIRTPIAM
jgi:hypothetical protein